MDKPLTDFLAFLADPANRQTLAQFDASDEGAEAVIAEHGPTLSPEQRTALIARDAGTLYRLLKAEQFTAWPFKIGPGPIKSTTDPDLLQIGPASSGAAQARRLSPRKKKAAAKRKAAKKPKVARRAKAKKAARRR